MSNSKNGVIQFILQLLKSIGNFVKASILSLVIILIIFLLLTQMKQGLTMVVYIVEEGWFSLFVSFFFINALALSLSHYPIYTYYAAHLNDSGKYFKWNREPMFKWKWLKWFPVYTFERIKSDSEGNYTIDYQANYLRYLLGFFVYVAWTLIIIKSFESSLKFDGHSVSVIMWGSGLALLIPFFLYIRLKRKLQGFDAKVKTTDSPDEKRLLRSIVIAFIVFCVLSLISLLTLMILRPYSKFGLVLILLTNLFMLFSYVYFRLIRVNFAKAQDHLYHREYAFIRRFLWLVKPLSDSKNYLKLFMVLFLISFCLITYSIYGSIHGFELTNGIPILLAYLYFYSYLIASIGKFFFVSRRLSLDNKEGGQEHWLFKVAFWSIFVLAISYFFHWGSEVKTHELEQVSHGEYMCENAYIDALGEHSSDTFFFVAAHGGGLKANIWTLNVLHHLDTLTDGQFMQKSVALSGASGGSLGLGLYTVLKAQHGVDTTAIRERIEALSKDDYTAVDLAMMFGPDLGRKLFPLNVLGGSKDRPYYSMVRYQNHVEETCKEDLSKVPFREYWKMAYDKMIAEKMEHFPSLIMNTSATNGQRGILWSLKSNSFSNTFHNSQNLADLSGGKTLSYYQAISMTNRFPLLSPAAKIRGYGHFIDAGAIENSGLLGCLNFYEKLKNYHCSVIHGRDIVFVEIVNSKSIYVRDLIKKFELKEIKHKIPYNENESATLITDLKAGLNLDKMPDYLSDYMVEWAGLSKKYHYHKIVLPHRVSIEDVEGQLSGEIEDCDVRKRLITFLEESNDLIRSVTEGKKGFFEKWTSLEPELSRQFSKSNLFYSKHILEHEWLKKEFEKIQKLTN